MIQYERTVVPVKRNLKTLRESLNMTQEAFGKSVGLAKTTYNNYEIGEREPKSDFWIAVAEKYGVSIDWLMGYEPPADSKKAPSLSDEAMKIAKDYSVLDRYGQQAVRDLVITEKKRCEDDAQFINNMQTEPEPVIINLYSEPAAAGIAVPTMGKDYTPYELKPEDPKSASYAIRIQGDSMEPAFHDGGIAFVNHDALDNGDIGVFCVDGGTVIKQYYHDPLGMTYLFSLNRKRKEADVLIYPSSGQTIVCQGRVITSKRYPLPSTY